MITKSLSSYLLLVGLLTAWLFPSFSLHAQKSEDLPAVTQVIAFTQVNVTSAPGQMSEKATVIVRDGLIEAVGQGIAIPADARVIVADSMFMYAGFIEALSHTGVPKPKTESSNSNQQNGQRARINPANPPYKRAGIQADRQLTEVLDPKDKSIADMRKLGFTAAHVVPRGRMLPGSGGIILLDGKKGDEMILKDHTSMFAQFKGASRVYPATVIAVMAKFRELYRQAELAKMHEQNYDESPAGMKRPSYDRVLQAFYPVIDKEQAIFFHAEKNLDAHRAMTLREDLGFPLVLTELQTAQDILPEIKANTEGVCISLDLPKDKIEEFEIEESLTGTALELATEKAAMLKRQAEALAKHNAQASELAKANIPFTFSTVEMKSKDFFTNLKRMHDAGLSQQDALAALTTNASKLLGVDAMLGTIEKGKIANLVIMNKAFLEDKAQIKYVVVDGNLHEYEIKERKKSSAKAGEKVEVVGTWSYLASIPGRELEGELVIKGEEGDYSGAISSQQGTLDVENVELDGNVLTFSYSVPYGGQSLDISVEVEIDGESFDGEMSVGQFGSFPMEGEKTGTPDNW